jgi:Flp pilus assembly protein TadB
MSRQRARLRAEREELAAAGRAKRAREADRRSARAARRRVVVDAVPRRRIRVARPRGILETRRRRRFSFVVALACLLQVLTWTLTDSWWLRATVAVLTLLFVPVILNLLAERRS